MVKLIETVILFFSLFFPWWLLWKYGESRLFPELTLAALFSSQTNTIVTMILVNQNLLEFPHRLFPHLTNIPISFDYAAFPVIQAFFYQWTVSRNGIKLFGIALMIASVITFLEYLMERYTNLIDYQGWTWYYTYSSVFIVLLINRFAVAFWFRKGPRRISEG
jgi:hypothetical protein